MPPSTSSTTEPDSASGCAAFVDVTVRHGSAESCTSEPVRVGVAGAAAVLELLEVLEVLEAAAMVVRAAIVPLR